MTDDELLLAVFKRVLVHDEMYLDVRDLWKMRYTFIIDGNLSIDIPEAAAIERAIPTRD